MNLSIQIYITLMRFETMGRDNGTIKKKKKKKKGGRKKGRKKKREDKREKNEAILIKRSNARVRHETIGFAIRT